MQMVQYDNLRHNLEQALTQHQSGDLKRAATLYHEVLNHYPNHPEALHLLGVIAHQQGNYEKASNLIREAIEHNPAAAAYYYNLGEALYEQRNFIEAAKAYSNCVKLEPDTTTAWNRLGLIEQNYNFDLEAARQAYTNALKRKPDFPQALNNYGLLEFSQQKYRYAIKLFQKALALQPDYAEAMHNLAITLQHLGEVDEAAELFQKTLRLNPELPGVQRQYINLLQNSCSWTKLRQVLFMLEKRTTIELENNQSTEESPLLHLTHSFDMQRNRIIAERRCNVMLESYLSKTVINHESK